MDSAAANEFCSYNGYQINNNRDELLSYPKLRSKNNDKIGSYVSQTLDNLSEYLRGSKVIEAGWVHTRLKLGRDEEEYYNNYILTQELLQKIEGNMNTLPKGAKAGDRNWQTIRLLFENIFEKKFGADIYYFCGITCTQYAVTRPVAGAACKGPLIEDDKLIIDYPVSSGTLNEIHKLIDVDNAGYIDIRIDWDKLGHSLAEEKAIAKQKKINDKMAKKLAKQDARSQAAKDAKNTKAAEAERKANAPTRKRFYIQMPKSLIHDKKAPILHDKDHVYVGDNKVCFKNYHVDILSTLDNESRIEECNKLVEEFESAIESSRFITYKGQTMDWETYTGGCSTDSFKRLRSSEKYAHWTI